MCLEQGKMLSNNAYSLVTHTFRTVPRGMRKEGVDCRNWPFDLVSLWQLKTRDRKANFLRQPTTPFSS